MESGLERESLGVILHRWTFPENLDKYLVSNENE